MDLSIVVSRTKMLLLGLLDAEPGASGRHLLGLVDAKPGVLERHASMGVWLVKYKLKSVELRSLAELSRAK